MKWIIGLFVLNLLLFPLNTSAKSFYSDGTVDNSDGTTNKELVFRDLRSPRTATSLGCPGSRISETLR